MSFDSVAANVELTRPAIVKTLFEYANTDNYKEFTLMVTMPEFDTSILKEQNEKGATMIHVNCQKCKDVDINILNSIGNIFEKGDPIFYLADYKKKTLVDYYHKNQNKIVKLKIAKFIADHTLYSTETLNLPTGAGYKF